MRWRPLICIFWSAFAQAQRTCEPPRELQAQRLGRSPAEAENITGAWFAQRNDTRCAIAAFEAALRLDPQSQDARYNLGLALIQTRQLQRAINELEILVKEAPGSARAHLALGMAFQDLGKFADAEPQFRTAVKLEPKSATALHHLGEVSARMQDTAGVFA